MRLALLSLAVTTAAAVADTVPERRDQLISKLKTQESVLTTRALGTGSVLELHGMYSEKNIEEVHLVVAFPFDATDARALDVAQVAALALSRSVEASAPVRGGGMADPGQVHLQFRPSKGDDLSPHLAKTFAAIGAPKLTAAHVDSAKTQLLKILPTGSLPADLGVARALYTNPPAHHTISGDERRKHVGAIDIAAVEKAIGTWKRGYLRITLNGGKPAPDATAKLVADAFKGWTLGPYVKPPAPVRKSKTEVARHALDQRLLVVQIELATANEIETAALLLLCQSRGTLRERVFERKHQMYSSALRDGSVVSVSISVSPTDNADAALAAIRAELQGLATRPISAKELTRLQEAMFDEPGAFEEVKQDPRSIVLQHAANVETIKAIAAITPAQLMAAAKKLAAAPQAAVIIERK